MTDSRPIYAIKSLGGIQRDGTTVDSQHYTDGQWVRFYRGRPRKIGGYKTVVEDLRYPTRGMFVSSKNNIHHVYLGNSHGLRQISVDNDTTSSISYDVTPTGFTSSEEYSWQFGSLFDATGGGEVSILAHGAKNVSNISSTENLPVYSSLTGSSSVFAPISDGAAGQVSVSGGICALQPYVVAYGNDGLLKVCNANNFNDWQVSVGNEADEVNVAYTKIVQGLPIRGGGQAPAGLFWSLESLIKMSWNNSTVWSYDPLGFTTLMSSNATVEVNGLFYWMGIDRFYWYNGKIDELPNQMNINWVFDNLNFEQRQKVWATVVPRFGEIWWYFPFGSGQIECNRAVIFNYVEKTWYDCQIERSSGFPAQVLRFPLWTGNQATVAHDVGSIVTFSGSEGDPLVFNYANHGFLVGQQGRFTNSAGTLPLELRTSSTHYIAAVPTSNTFTVSTTPGGPEVVMGPPSGPLPGDNTFTAIDVPSYALYSHEHGLNRVENGDELSIESYVVTSDLGFPSGGPMNDENSGQDFQTRLIRFEPDFILQGNLEMTVLSQDFAQSETVRETTHIITPTTEKIDLREQGRMVRLKFSSNEVGGFFEAGRSMLHTEPGDIRP